MPRTQLGPARKTACRLAGGAAGLLALATAAPLLAACLAPAETAHISERCDPPRPDPYLECYWELQADTMR